MMELQQQNPEDDENNQNGARQINIEGTIGTGVQSMFSLASNVGYFLPTWTNLFLDALIPFLYDNKSHHCAPHNTIYMIAALSFCAFCFCFVFSFTDSLELPDDQGGGGGGALIFYGFVLPCGLYVPGHGWIRDERYRLGFGDVFHAVMSTGVFLLLALSDHRVMDCLFSKKRVADLSSLMRILMLFVGAVGSFLYRFFPINRRGFLQS